MEKKQTKFNVKNLKQKNINKNSNIILKKKHDINHSLNLTEEQENIINTESENIIVNGVPGSAKTTTLALRIATKIFKSGKSDKKYNIIIITKVSNVSEELVKKIKNFLEGIEFKKQKDSSRITCSYKGHNIEISNYDAFIHSQLIPHKKNLKFEGNDFRKKEKFFNEYVINDKIHVKIFWSKIKVNKIILDEVQDFSQEQAKVILNILENNNNISFEGYGDILQSIWYESCDELIKQCKANNSIDIFKTLKKIKSFCLTTCFRLPKLHIEFLNTINKGNNKKYNRKQIKHFLNENENERDKIKVMYLMHGCSNTNKSAKIAAKKYLIIIEEILKNDDDIKPEDIAVMSTNINDNLIISNLHSMLKNSNIPVHLFKTKDGETKTTIDMNELKEEKCCCCSLKYEKKSDKCKRCKNIRKENKISIISGHGFKGGERKCIIVLGLSEKSIPKINNINSENELQDISLFTVLCSRSKKYLIISSNYNPSRYITNNIFDLNNCLYISQDFQYYLKKKIEDIAKKNCEKNKVEKYSTQYSSVKNDDDNDDDNDDNDGNTILFLRELKILHSENNIEKITKLKINPDDPKSKLLFFLKEQGINDIKMKKSKCIYKNITNKIIEFNKKNDINHFNIPLMKLIKENNSSLNTPDKNIMNVTYISEMCNELDSFSDIINCLNIEEEKFGVPCDIIYKKTTSILGNLPNIIISQYRNDSFNKLLKRVKLNINIIYIDESEFPYIINILKDKNNVSFFIEGIKLDLLITILKKDNNKQNNFINFLKSNHNIEEEYIFLPDYFKNINKGFKEYNESNEFYWNICFLYEFIFSSKYVDNSFMLDKYSDYITGDLKNSIKNIIHVNNNFDNIETEVSSNISYNERNDDILTKELNFDKKKNAEIIHEGYECGINGRIDAISEDFQMIHEFKMSVSNELSKSWIIQVLLYCFLGAKYKINKKYKYDENYHQLYNNLKYNEEETIFNFQKAIIYNFITGIKYHITFDLIKIKNQHFENFFLEILKKKKFTVKLRKNFLKHIISKKIKFKKETNRNTFIYE